MNNQNDSQWFLFVGPTIWMAAWDSRRVTTGRCHLKASFLWHLGFLRPEAAVAFVRYRYHLLISQTKQAQAGCSRSQEKQQQPRFFLSYSSVLTAATTGTRHQKTIFHMRNAQQRALVAKFVAKPQIDLKGLCPSVFSWKRLKMENWSLGYIHDVRSDCDCAQ